MFYLLRQSKSPLSQQHIKANKVNDLFIYYLEMIIMPAKNRRREVQNPLVTITHRLLLPLIY